MAHVAVHRAIERCHATHKLRQRSRAFVLIPKHIANNAAQTVSCIFFYKSYALFSRVAWAQPEEVTS